MIAIDNMIDNSFIDAIAAIESGGDLNAIGDRHLKYPAYGVLQITQPYLDDVNRWNGTNHTVKELLGDKELSYWVFRQYMKIYATEERLGRQPTLEDMARIHNGGPKGHLKIKATEPYITKLRKVADKFNLKLA